MGKASRERLPDEAREALTCLFNHIDDLTCADPHGGEADHRLAQGQRSQPAAGLRAGCGTHNGNGACRSGGRRHDNSSLPRHFAAWLGLTPRIRASGEKERIGRISKGGDRYLRTLLIHGARAVVGTAFRKV